MSYIISTDSTCDLGFDYYKKHDIKIVGLTYHIREKDYHSCSPDSLTDKEFYDVLREGEMPSTSQVNTFEFIEFIEPFLKDGHDVVHLGFSSGLSGSYASYMRSLDELREKYPERKLFISDSLAAAPGEGLLLDYMIKNRSNGMSVEDNFNWVEKNKLHMIHIVTVNDLMHLHRGGRVSKASAVVGSVLGIKPIIEVDNEGKLEVTAKIRGRDKSLLHLVELMKKKSFDNIKDQTIFIGHGDCIEDAEKLADMVRTKIGAKDIHISYIGPVIGSHTGPGVVAMFFMGESRI